MNAEPNTQMLLKINVIETTFLGVLAGNCKTDYVVVHDGKHVFQKDSVFTLLNLEFTCQCNHKHFIFLKD